MTNADLNIYCDGGARGNPGPSASAFVVIDRGGNEIYSNGVFIGTATNNVAEYTAVLNSLEWLISPSVNITAAKVDIYLDSLLVVKQLNHEFKIKDFKLKLLYNRCRELINKLNFMNINFIHTVRENNFRADYLVNLTLDRQL